MEVVETVEYLGYKIKIGYQDDPENPRDSQDRFGKIVYNHRKYTLGDFKLTEHGESFEDDLFRELYPDLMDKVDDGNILLNEVSDKLNNEYYFIPLKLYDHSGISLTTGPHGTHTTGGDWDSGMVGYIYIDKEKAKQEYEGFTEEEVEKKSYEYMEGEIKIFNQYLTGEIYSFEVDYINEGWGHECYSIEEAIDEAKEYINEKDPEGKILKSAKELYETELDNFWDTVGEKASTLCEDTEGEEDEEQRDLIISIVGELLRAY